MQSITLDAARGLVVTQAGATWLMVLDALATHGLTLAACPLELCSTVGGGVSTGMLTASSAGASVLHLLHSVDVVVAEGEVVTCSPTSNRRLFWSVVGGFGLLGVVVCVRMFTVPDAPCQYVATACCARLAPLTGHSCLSPNSIVVPGCTQPVVLGFRLYSSVCHSSPMPLTTTRGSPGFSRPMIPQSQTPSRAVGCFLLRQLAQWPLQGLLA